MLISSDGDIRKVFSLTDEQIGEIIGKSRQAVNHGLKDGKSYFKAQQWKLIALALHERNHDRLPNLLEYLDSKDIKIGHLPQGEGPIEIGTVDIAKLDARTVEVIVSDFFHFSTQHRQCCAQLMSLAMGGAQRFVFYYSTDADREHIEGILGDTETLVGQKRSTAIEFVHILNASQYPFMFSFLSRESSDRQQVTCLQDRYVRPDQFVYARIYNHALSQDVVRDNGEEVAAS